MNLIYLSPVPFASFAQRPHKFVLWFLSRYGGPVLWVDPYPTRLPRMDDFARLRRKGYVASTGSCPDLEVVKPFALPIEPLPLSGIINGIFWRDAQRRIEQFARHGDSFLVIGKPSLLALSILEKLPDVPSLYDAMDDFPAFHSGLSAKAMKACEAALVGKVTTMFTSSTALHRRWCHIRPDAQLIHNGLDNDILPPLKMPASYDRKILGYVGTMGSWFDWEWIQQLAVVRPKDTIRLIGPVISAVPPSLPPNVELKRPCGHTEALAAMQGFDVALIPFKRNELTESVDPIKYYEYRSLGLPVLSTDFGEMAYRREERGTYICSAEAALQNVVSEALTYRADEATVAAFRAENSWMARFDAAILIR